MGSIFTKLIERKLPTREIYRDEEIFAFLDIRPLTLGHSLVVPIQEIDHFLDIPQELYLKVMQKCQYIGKAIHRATKSSRIGMIVQGFEVPHFHVHLVPINSPSDMLLKNARPRSQEEMDQIHSAILREL